MPAESFHVERSALVEEKPPRHRGTEGAQRETTGFLLCASVSRWLVLGTRLLDPEPSELGRIVAGLGVRDAIRIVAESECRAELILDRFFSFLAAVDDIDADFGPVGK